MTKRIDPKKTEFEPDRRFRAMCETLGATADGEGRFSVTINGQKFASALEASYSGDYFVDTTDWRAKGSTIQLSVDEDFYNLVKSGDPILVKVGPGRLGWPWVIGIQRLSPTDTRTIQ